MRRTTASPKALRSHPFSFILETELALASLHESWAKRGLGYLIDGLWLQDVAYADDVVLLAMSTAALQILFLEVEEAFAAVGLALNLGKTTFTSTVVCEGESLRARGEVISTAHLPGITVITLSGNDDEAIRARMTRAMRAFQNWSPILTNIALLGAARVTGFFTSVLSSHAVGRQRTGHRPKNNTATSAVGLLASDHPCADSAVALMDQLIPGGGGLTETERSSGQSTVLTWSARSRQRNFALHVTSLTCRSRTSFTLC